MINRFLGKREIVDILLTNQKAEALFSPTTRRVMQWLGVVSLRLFGFPQTVSARTRAQDVLKMMSQISGSLVDIGCSTGAEHTFELARRLAPNPVLGLDINPISIDVARCLNQALCLENLSFEVGDISVAYEEDLCFDIAFTSETLEHIQDDAVAMNNIARMVKPGGWLVISVPYCESPAEFEVSKAVFDALPSTSELFRGGYHWRSGYNEDQMTALIRSVGFEVISVAYTRTASVIPDRLYFFPIAYVLSRLASPLFGTIRKINVLARKST